SCIQSAMPGTSRKLRTWLEMTHRASTMDFLCRQRCVHEAMTAPRLLRQQALQPTRPSKLSTSACTSGRECFKPPQALTKRYPTDEVRGRAGNVSLSPGISHCSHPLTLEGNACEKQRQQETAA